MKDTLTIILTAAFSFFVLVGIFAGGGAIGRSQGERMIQQEAVERGAGRWTIDATTGEKRFEWTPATETKP